LETALRVLSNISEKALKSVTFSRVNHSNSLDCIYEFSIDQIRQCHKFFSPIG